MGYANKVLEKLAENFGDLEIVKHGKKVYSYDTLNNRANQIARTFLKLGAKKGDKYGILLYNSPEYLEIMFGLQKIEVIPVPINVKYGSTEFRYIYENADIKGVFIDKNFIGITLKIIDEYKFENFNHIFVVGADIEEKFNGMLNYEQIIKDKETTNLELQVDDDGIGLLLYTGGTTGLPKGAMLTHSNLYNATYLTPTHGMKLVKKKKIPAKTLIPPPGMIMKFLIPTPIFHVSGLMPVLTNLGMRHLMIFPVSKSFDPKEICQIIQDEKITTVFMVPTMYRLWLDFSDLDKFDLSSLTMITSGGAKMSKDMKIEILEKFPDKVLVDGYGSTETIGTSTIAFMTHDNIPKIKKGYIGQIVTGVKMRVVNEEGENVPVGIVGEMIYKGRSIMKGYYKDDEKTREVIDEEGWLRSGDLCKMDNEGNVYYVGRTSELIISGGEKIFPGEIEDFLRTHPKINNVAISGKQDDKWGQIIIAFITLEPGKTMTSSEVSDFCASNIASYKKPRIVNFIDSLPLTKAGKLDRNEIKKLAESINI
ncbi:MAG: class I adenylate-forming enzyme family protein [Promethearchaeota archaeon]